MSKTTSQGSIAKNSMALTLRMILRLVVSLYTTRVILHSLGVDDFGIYNVVAGFTVMFSFVNTSMSTAISRFIAYDLGQKNALESQIETFRIAYTTQFFIAISVIILAETIGLPLINNYLEIPKDKIKAANILFQCTLVSMSFNILQVPYNATIMAYERMTAYAYIELVYVFLLLGIAIALQQISGNLLVYYGLMLVGVNIIVFLCYRIYSGCFGICKTKLLFNWDKAKPMLKFSGADFYSNCSLSLQSQGQNIIINRFFGLVANAAVGVSNQIYGALLMFSSSMTTAIRPRIIKYFAAKEDEKFRTLIFDGSRLVSFVNLLICIPLIVLLPKVLSLWLGDVPKYAVTFCRILIFNHCVFSYKTILIAGLHATGNISKFSLLSGSLFIISIPFQFFIAWTGVSAGIVYGLLILLTGINIYLIAQALERHTPLKCAKIFKDIILPPFIVAILIVTFEFLTLSYIPDSLVNTICIGSISLFLAVVLSFYIVLNKNSRQILKSYTTRLICRFINFHD